MKICKKAAPATMTSGVNQIASKIFARREINSTLGYQMESNLIDAISGDLPE
jgi:hypothetical protein